MKYMIADCASEEVYEGNKDKLYADIKSSNLVPINDTELDSMFLKSSQDDPINFLHSGKYYDCWLEF